MSNLTGGCQCGAVRYEIAGAPVATYVCHCRECRKQSASAFGISVIVRAGDFNLKQGTVKSWTRSEEHTSELQSHLNLVCRLLLEKKKKSSRDTSDRRGRYSPARLCIHS